MTKNVIEFQNVNFSYPTQEVLKSINLEVKQNDFMAILGPNGGGKTTLLQLILGFQEANSGVVNVLGTSPRQARNRIGYVPQYGDFDRDFPMKVDELVMMSGLTGKSFTPWYSKADRKRAKEMLEIMKIEHLTDRRLNELSGGQKQRALISRALFSDPDILILDEPTASVDSSIEKDIYETLRQLNEDKTILLVSHDISFISKYVNKVTCLNLCSCTHTVNELGEKSLLEVYNGAVHSLHHQCGL